MESEAKAGAFTLDPKLARLFEDASSPAPARFDEAFEAGQLAGPHGPKFVGYGRRELRHHWQNWRGTIGLAAGMAALALALVVLK